MRRIEICGGVWSWNVKVALELGTTLKQWVSPADQELVKLNLVMALITSGIVDGVGFWFSNAVADVPM